MASSEYLLRYAEPAAPSTYYYIASSLGRTSAPGDIPASTAVPGGLPPLNFEVSLFDGVDPPAPSPRGGFGVIRIPDPKGRLDYLIGKVMDGGTLTLLKGVAGAPFSTFSAVASLTAAGMTYNHDRKEIRLRDLAWLLSAPLHDNRYGGTGGADGDATVKGQMKPWLLGRCFNVTPTLVDPVKLIYQINDGPFEEIEELTDGNSQFDVTNDGDVANYAALDAATVTNGTYKTCKAEGFFRVNQVPVWGYSLTVRGDKTAGTYVDKRADIVKRIVTKAGTALSSGQVDATSLTAMNTDFPGQCGFFWNSEISKAAALSEALSGICGFWFLDLAGILKFAALSTPSGTPLRTFMFPTECGPAETTDDYTIPRWKTTLGYQRNHTVRSDSQLSGAVSPGNRIYYQTDAQWTTAETTNQRTYWPTAPEVKKLSGYMREENATPEAARQKAMFAGIPTNGRNVARYRMPIYIDAIALMAYLGKVVAIANHPRLGWANPQKFYLVGAATAGLTSIAHLWG